VNRGELPDLASPPGGDPTRSDFYFIEREDPAAARETLLELVTGRIPARFGFDPVRDMQVLTPMHRGELGTMALNRALQARLNPAGEGRAELVRGDRVLREGDKVMQVKNDYDRDVFNGDVGVIRAIQTGEEGEGEARGLTVEMADGRTVQYAATDVEQLAHAFAISVHKSQGSEYPAVVIPLLTQHYLMLERNLLYTAITRGKRLVVVVGSRRAVKMAVENGAGRRRWTWLAQRIRAAQGVTPEPGLAATTPQK
jgi:exodeoxyribonuclease V alpha subunit